MCFNIYDNKIIDYAHSLKGGLGRKRFGKHYLCSNIFALGLHKCKCNRASDLAGITKNVFTATK